MVLRWICGLFLLCSSQAWGAELVDLERPQDYAHVMAVFLAVVHLAAPFFKARFEKNERALTGFGAGMAISYVFLQLLPELGNGEHELGRFLYLLVLIGFLAYLGLHRRSGFRIQSLPGFWLYSWLLVYSMPLVEGGGVLHAVLVAMALMLHLAHSDFELARKDPNFNRRTRYILASAPLVGALCRHLFMDQHPGLLLIALTAGALMYSTFEELLTKLDRLETKSFLLGVVLYSLLLTAAVGY